MSLFLPYSIFIFCFLDKTTLGNFTLNSIINLKTSLIAPCGMNCGLCLGYHRTKNKCTGCNSTGSNKPNHCINCLIKLCDSLQANHSRFCFNCKKYPCTRIKNLDKRYKVKYGMSMIENLNTIKEIGIRKFVQREKERWTCPKCGNMICVHRDSCLICGTKRIIKSYK